MKKLILFFLLAISLKVNAQIFTQTYVDKCTGEIKIVTTTPAGNGMVVVAFYNQIRTFTNADLTNGTVQSWLNQVYADYNSRPCPVTNIVQQTVTQAVAQQAASAAASAASSAAASAASSSASAAASSSASAAASSSASSSAAGSSASSPPPSSSSQSGGSSSSNSSQSGGNSSSESKTESKSEGTKSESKSESKSEEKKEESKSESKEESKEEKKEESKEEKKEEKKEDKKDDKKKKQQNTNPTLIASDLAVTQSADGRYTAMVSTGISKSSMTGTSSWGLTSLIWMTFDQFALNGGYTKMNFDKGKLNNIKSYSMTAAYLQGNFMIMQGHTYIKPHPKIGTYGYNVGVISLLIKNGNKYDYSLSSSLVGFWTKPYQMNKRLSISPQIFITSSPIAWNPSSGQTIVSRDFGYMGGASYDYKLTKRFGLNLSYRFAGSTKDGSKILHNFMIGSRILL